MAVLTVLVDELPRSSSLPSMQSETWLDEDVSGVDVADALVTRLGHSVNDDDCDSPHLVKTTLSTVEELLVARAQVYWGVVCSIRLGASTFCRLIRRWNRVRNLLRRLLVLVGVPSTERESIMVTSAPTTISSGEGNGRMDEHV